VWIGGRRRAGGHRIIVRDPRAAGHTHATDHPP
jgi:hypothetical protein